MKVHSSLSLFIITIYMLIQPISAIAHEQPNVVFFLVDDLGWADTASNGSKIYNPPNIDALANEGVSFNRAYGAHPLCIGSRFALMTGKYPARIKKVKILALYSRKKKLWLKLLKYKVTQPFLPENGKALY